MDAPDPSNLLARALPRKARQCLGPPRRVLAAAQCQRSSPVSPPGLGWPGQHWPVGPSLREQPSRHGHRDFPGRSQPADCGGNHVGKSSDEFESWYRVTSPSYAAGEPGQRSLQRSGNFKLKANAAWWLGLGSWLRLEGCPMVYTTFLMVYTIALLIYTTWYIPYGIYHDIYHGI
jgi:hypothetical protein